MEYQVWLNGEFMPRSEAKLGLTDRGLRLGDVVFEGWRERRERARVRVRIITQKAQVSRRKSWNTKFG